jgi:dihydrofolate reductase
MPKNNERRVVVSEFMTLDGVMEAPDKWSFPFWNGEIAKFKNDELFASDGLLLGRVTYQGFAAAWPTMKDEQGYADRMNGYPKFVVTSTLSQLEWNNSHVVSGNIAREVLKLKQQPGKDLLVFGSADLVRLLIKHDLVDEYRLLVYPLVRGSGKRLFADDNTTADLKLVESRSYPTGVVLLRYDRLRSSGV